MAKYSWMKVSDLMTRNPVSISPSETVAEAEELMAENRIRQLPVVENSTLIGVVTDRDLRSFLSGSLFCAPEERERALTTRIGDIMTTNPFTLSPDDELQEAVELLLEQKVGGAPVTDASDGLAGIITYIDLLQCLLNRIQED